METAIDMFEIVDSNITISKMSKLLFGNECAKVTVYVVNYIDGNYGGRGHFCGVFSNREKAEKYIAQYNDPSDLKISECEVDKKFILAEVKIAYNG
jgi:hypothetical protein